MGLRVEGEFWKKNVLITCNMNFIYKLRWKIQSYCIWLIYHLYPFQSELLFDPVHLFRSIGEKAARIVIDWYYQRVVVVRAGQLGGSQSIKAVTTNLRTISSPVSKTIKPPSLDGRQIKRYLSKVRKFLFVFLSRIRGKREKRLES